jgi:hypothetical protein
VIGLLTLPVLVAWRAPRFRTYVPIPWAALALGVAALLASGAIDDRRVVLGASSLAFLEVMIVSAIATLFSAFSSPFLSAVFTIGVFIVGRETSTLGRLPVRVFGETVKRMGAFLVKVIPNLEVYVPPRPLLTGEVPSSSLAVHLGLASAQALGWSVGLLVVSSFIFQRRDLRGPKTFPTAARVVHRGLTFAVQLGLRPVRRMRTSMPHIWAAGDVIGATVHARAAARAYVPFAPHVGRAYLRLRTIAQDSEARGDVEAAIFAWRAVRAAAVGSRSLFTSHERQREVADAAIARLSAAAARSMTLRAGADTFRTYVAAHGGDVAPRPLWGPLLLVGAALWAGAAFRFTSRTSPAWSIEGRPRMAEVRMPVAGGGGRGLVGGPLHGVSVRPVKSPTSVLLLCRRAGKVGRVGFWDRARSVLGLGKETSTMPERERTSSTRADRSERRKKRDGRPPLPEVMEGASATIEDALVARQAGSMAEARSILAAIDKGQGLRTVLRAAAALEAGDEEELSLIPAIQKEEPVWQLRLQVAAVLDRGAGRDGLVRDATKLGAPAWSLAWVRAVSSDDAERRQGLVDLLFEDAALARTVAARDLAMPDVKADNDAIRRYAAFAHGRDVIQRFGAKEVARLLERTSGKSN